MESLLTGFAEAIQSSPFGHWAGRSQFAYPVANLVHLLGLVMLVGGIGLVDLRLAGGFRSLPPAALSRVLTPVPTFQRKLVLIALALANAALFRWIWGKRIADWEASPPLGGRLMAGASILLWLVVAAHGRMIAYS